MKELVDHLRTVHFTILVISLVLIVSSFEQTRKATAYAYLQAKKILEGAQRFPEVVRTIEETADEAVAQQPGTDQGKVLAIETGTARVRRVVRVTHGWVLTDMDWRGRLRARSKVYLEPWRDLDNFAWIWNHQRRFYAVQALPRSGELPKHENAGRVINEAGPYRIKELTGDELTAAGTPIDCDVAAEPSPIVYEGQLNATPILECAIDGQPHQWTFPEQRMPRIDVGPRPGGFQQTLSGVLGLTVNYDGPFEEKFPDLSSAATQLMYQPLTELVPTLQKEIENEKTTDIFGVRVPLEQVSQFGVVALVISLLYLWMHIRELGRLRRRDETFTDWPSGFIGLYDDLFSRLFFTLSITVVPALALGSTLFHVDLDIESASSMMFRVASSGLTLLLGIGCTRTLAKVRDFNDETVETLGRDPSVSERQAQLLMESRIFSHQPTDEDTE